MSTLGSLWNRFWFAPSSAVPLALFRIAFGIVVMLYALQATGPLFFDYFGNKGMVSPKVLAEALGAPVLNILPPTLSDQTLLLALIALWVAAISLTVGFWTRPAAIVVYLLLNSFNHRNILLLSSAETIMRVAAFALMFAPRDLPFSVDWAIRKVKGQVAWPPKPIPPFVQRFVALQIAIVYLATIGWKIQGSDWINGTAAYFANNLLVFRNPYFPIPLTDMAIVNIATYGTLVAEFVVAVFAWFPQTRLPALAVGVLLHLGIAWNMHLWFFSAMMISAYICFLDEDDCKRFLGFLQARWHPKEAAVVFYDGACGFCRRAKQVVEAVDVFAALEWRDFRRPGALDGHPLVSAEACEHALQLELPGGKRVLGGFRAFLWMAGRIPLAWPVLPLLHLPGVGWVGDRVYDWVANHRFSLGCASDGKTCPTQPPMPISEPGQSPLVS